MDIHIRYWDTSLNTVKTIHYNSQFMGKQLQKMFLKYLKNVSVELMKASYLNVNGQSKCEYIIFNFFE